MAVTNYASGAVAITKAFSASWGTTTPVSWPNVPFTPPNGQNWIRFQVQYSTSHQLSMGQIRYWRIVGFVSFQVFSVEGEGPAANDQLCDQISSFFRGTTIDGRIHFQAPVTTTTGNQDGWFQQNVRAPFYFDIQQ